MKININKLEEPYAEEMQRIRPKEMSREAIDFAYTLECVKSAKLKSLIVNKSKSHFYQEKNSFYTRIRISEKSPSLGLILTNIDLNRLKLTNHNPTFWQMGPERMRLALAQRALFYDQNQNTEIHKFITSMEKEEIIGVPRKNTRSVTIDSILGITKQNNHAINTPAISELGYKKISTDKLISRREIIKKGLFNKIGKYPRKIIGLGAMPPVTGWRDTMVTSAIGHMISFIPRSSIFAFDIKSRVKLGNDISKTINSLPMPSTWKKRSLRNIGAAIGAENPKEELKTVENLYKYAGIRLFRIYTIGSDKRIIDTAHLIRQKFGDDVEIFVGQIADKKQAHKLISSDIRVEGLIYGHGGGQQCTSAINGMAITTLEDIYEITLDEKFNSTSILIEGGLGRSIGTALILGADACLGNQKLVHGTIETGNLFVQDKAGRICQPYPGTASPVTQIIESQDTELRSRRIDAAGRTYYSEGKPGLMYYEAKAGSMSFWINEYLSHAARTLADLGVENIYHLRKLISNNKYDFLRILTEKNQYLSEPHWNY